MPSQPTAAELLAQALEKSGVDPAFIAGMRVRGGGPATPVEPAPHPPNSSDLPPLTEELLEHLAWMAQSPLAIVHLEKPQLARLLDDRAELIAALRDLLRCTAIDDAWREPAERLLTGLEG